MIRFKAALAALLVAAPVLGSAAPLTAAPASSTASGVLPGYWEYQAKVFGIGVDKERRCLSADKIESFLFNPCNRHHRCTYPTKVVKDGKVQLDGTWTDKRGRQAKVKGNGTYTPTTMTLKANVRTITGIPLSGTFSARRIGDTCPAGAEAA
jgi:hypothetical protein